MGEVAKDNSMIHTVEEFSQASGIPLYFFYQWAQEDAKERLHYRHVEIPKKTGGARTLSIPSKALKKAQKQILQFLEDAVSVAPSAWAYRKGKDLKGHAEVHAGAPLLMRTDLTGFFDAITFSQVFWAIDRALKASPRFGPGEANPQGGNTPYNPRLSWFLAKACTLDDRLPQGSPASPLLSNAVMSAADRRITGYCSRRNIAYTRYADDLIFSGASFSRRQLTAFLETVLAEYGFSLNEKKTAMLGSGRPHKVTGLMANSKPQVPAAYRKKIRQEMYYIGKFGLRSHLEKKGLLIPLAKDHQHSPEGGPAVPSDTVELVRYTRQLLGRIQFVLQINPTDPEFLQYKRECLHLLGQLPWVVLK